MPGYVFNLIHNNKKAVSIRELRAKGWKMNWYKKIMWGRSGLDQLSVALCVLSLILSMAANATNLMILTALGSIILGIAVYRIMSKNVSKRNQENQRFLSKWNPLVSRFRERKTHKYFKCPNCGQRLRVPKNKGNVSINCPKCGTGFKGRT
jgi:predicted RNA-binding Zn-ribbon protein involved in translation (DUF1610 family)